MVPDAPTDNIYSIGHSNHTLDVFIALLKAKEIRTLVDVRSYPRSRYSPHFSRDHLAAALAEQGIMYTFGGEPLGGRPDGEAFYDAQGRVRYDALAATDSFRTALRRVTRMKGRHAALMCSEEDPGRCHRHLLIARALVKEGITISHIRGDGRIETAADTERRLTPGGEAGQRRLPGHERGEPWKSTQSVSLRKLPRTSSKL